MLVTFEGISIEVKPLQPEKAELPMLVTSSPKVIVLIDVSPLNQFSIVFVFISTEVKPLQP
jgi:hypothetical protein